MAVAAYPPRRILVATDFSEPAGAAVARAARLARAHDAGLTVVHVLPEHLDSGLAGHIRERLRAHVG